MRILTRTQVWDAALSLLETLISAAPDERVPDADILANLPCVHSALVLFGNYGGRPCRFEITELSDDVVIASDAVSENVSSTSTGSPYGHTT